MEEHEVELIDYLRVIWRRKGLILGGTLLAATTALVVSLYMSKTYEATVTLLVTESKVPSAEGPPIKTGISPETFHVMIRNQSIAEKAIEKFNLGGEPYALGPGGFLNRVLSVNTKRGTNVITVRVVFSDSKLTKDIANFVAEESVGINIALNQADTLKTRDYIKAHLNEARAKMEQTQAELVRFQREARLATLRKEVEILLSQMSKLGNTYVNVFTSIAGDRAELKELSEQIKKHQKIETIVKSIEKEPGLLIAADKDNPGPKRDLLGLEMKSEEFNPVYRHTEQAIVKTRGTLASLEARRDDLRGRLTEIEKKLAEAEIQLVNKKARLEEFTRNFTLAKDAYELFAKKFEEASLSVASRVNDLKIVDRAVVPRDPVKPRVKQNVALAGTLGLFMFTFLAFFLEYLANVRKAKSS